MGCAVGKRNPDSSRRGEGADFTVELIVGSGVKPSNDDSRKLLFVFGGPGSRKGHIVSDLAQCFGFETISAEKLILAHFAEQLEIEPADSYRETTQGVRILLKNEPTLLTLPLLLDLVKKELEVQLQDKPVAAFLVDPMPNLPYMLPTKLQLNSCEQEMRHFENEWPCLFALNLAVSEVRPGNKHIQRVLGDEKDAARTKKRQQEYTDNVQGFLAYFRDTRRLVSVDVGQNSGTAVSTQLVQLLTALGFVPRSSVDPSFIFLPITKSKRRNSKVDTVENKWFGPGGPNKPDSALQSRGCACLDSLRATSQGAQGGLLGKPLQVSSHPSRHFFAVVCWEGLARAASDVVEEDRRVMFQEHERLGWTEPLQAVRTTFGEGCLFPSGTDWKTCRQVALLCTRHLCWQCTLPPP